jgi:hypothetical protein
LPSDRPGLSTEPIAGPVDRSATGATGATGATRASGASSVTYNSTRQQGSTCRVQAAIGLVVKPLSC